MNASTRAVRDELDAAMARLDTQLLRSADAIELVAASLADTAMTKAAARRLAIEAARMREAATGR